MYDALLLCSQFLALGYAYKLCSLVLFNYWTTSKKLKNDKNSSIQMIFQLSNEIINVWIAAIGLNTKLWPDVRSTDINKYNCTTLFEM